MAIPLTADRLVAALRAEGVKVVEHDGWRTHNRNHVGAWGPVSGVVIHHTVSTGTASSVELCFNGYQDLPGPLCHGVIAKDGTVYLVGNGRANHAGGGDAAVLAAVQAEDYDTRPPATNQHQGSAGAVDGNSRFYGFECINLGDGKDPWPAAQLDAIERTSAAICRAHGWGARSVIGHLEWSDWKSDPRGFTMPDMRGRIATRLASAAGQTPDPSTAPEDQESPDMPDLLMLNESQPADTQVPVTGWVDLPFDDAVLHKGPRAQVTMVHLQLADTTPVDAAIEGRFYLANEDGGSPSSFLPVTKRGPGGHQFTCASRVPEGRFLRFQARAITQHGESLTVVHRTASGPYWAA